MATTAHRAQVTQLYAALFGRAPDLEGLNFWTTRLAAGDTLIHVADVMYGTAPARAYYPQSLAHVEIIASFYLNVLGRQADAGGLAFWTAKLDAPGATSGSVIVEMLAIVTNYAGTDPAGLMSQQLFNNKVIVGLYYVDHNGSIAGATRALAGVTADPISVEEAIAAIDGVTLDRAGPVFTGAAITHSTLALTYSDANPLDPTHAPGVGAFAVTVANVARAVGAVVVDANAKTVMLTLASDRGGPRLRAERPLLGLQLRGVRWQFHRCRHLPGYQRQRYLECRDWVGRVLRGRSG